MKTAISLIGISIISFILASDDPKAYGVLEQLSSNAIGVIVSGVIAAVALIFGLLAGARFMANLNDEQRAKFKSFCANLKRDIFILLCLLGASIAMPYLRKANLPLIQYPNILNHIVSFDTFYTTIEIAVLFVSIQVVVEIVSVLFDIFDLKFNGR